MASILDRLRSPAPTAQLDRFGSWDAYVDAVTKFTFNGVSYSIGNTREPGREFEQFVQQVHAESNVVAAAVVARALMLKTMRFAWRNRARNDANYRQLFGTPELEVLERPAQGMTRSEWLTTCELHASYAGSAYTVRRESGRLEVLRPDYVRVVLVGADEPDAVMGGRQAKVAGWIYFPDGPENPETQESLKPDDMVMHWRPEPHPVMWWTGQSWVTSVLSEVTTDRAAQKHLRKFFDNAATPNLIVKPHEMMAPEVMDEYRERFEQRYGGVANSFRTMWLGGGADAMVVGSQLADLDLSTLQGGAETRIAARSRVPASILGINAGLEGSSLNAGNYSAARRQFADMWFAPTAEDFCAAAESLVRLPPGGPAELWYDPSESMALQEDALDAAQIMQTQAAAVRQMIDAGYDPDAAVSAVRDGNLSALVGAHTGLTSVQLVPPDEGGDSMESDGGGGDG